MVENNTTPSCNTEKCCQIRKWVSAFLKAPAEIFVGEYSYTTPEGTEKTKSIICILDKFPEEGIFCIDKCIDDIQPSDVLMFYKTLHA